MASFLLGQQPRAARAIKGKYDPTGLFVVHTAWAQKGGARTVSPNFDAPTAYYFSVADEFIIAKSSSKSRPDRVDTHSLQRRMAMRSCFSPPLQGLCFSRSK
jgi:hypothetical protein